MEGTTIETSLENGVSFSDDASLTHSAPLTNNGAQSVWGLTWVGAVCPHCDWRYFVPEEDVSSLRCPHCWQADLERLGEDVRALPYIYPPELVLPFSVPGRVVAQHIETFAADIPFAPSDLNSENLKARVRRIMLPMWLVDSEIQATWEAEAGFDYEVVSHKERYVQSGWATQEVQETRVRWEPRVGRLVRVYHNIAVPALEEHATLQNSLGEYRLESTCSYTTEQMTKAFIRLPDRAPTAAWSDAVLMLQQLAGEECRQAAKADHLRHFHWSPTYSAQNWTLLLLPMYATYYLNDESQPLPVLINGQSGQLYGIRRGSLRQAQRRALILALIAVVLFVVGLIVAAVGMMIPLVLILAALILGIALVMGLWTLVPIVRVWRFNRTPARLED